MFKLLPEETRVRVANEYKLRRTVVIITALTLVLLVALIGLFPSYILSKVKQAEAEALSLASLSNEEDEDLVAWLTTFNRKLRALSASAEEEKASLAIEKALVGRIAGIKITQLRWRVNQAESDLSEEATLSIFGIATDRQSLLSFETGLKNSGHFSEVVLPLSNLAKERDIAFQIDLSLKTP